MGAWPMVRVGPSSPETNEPAFMIDVSSENIEPSTPGGHRREPSVMTFYTSATRHQRPQRSAGGPQAGLHAAHT